MTQTRKEALTDLLAKVEAGNLPREQIAIAAFDVQPDLRLRRTHVVDAFDGSLDAAKALHEAVLPEWRMSVSQSEIIGDDDTFLAVVWPKDATKRESVFRPAGRHAIEARARLIAILKALIAQETDQ